MNWIVLVIIAMLGDAIVIYTDNYISDVFFKGRNSVGQKVFYGWQYVILSTILLFLFNVQFDTLPIQPVLALVGTGLISSISSVFYYRALEIENSTNLSIFFQLSPIFYLIFGWMLMGESIGLLQLLAIAVILMGPILIVLCTRKNSRKTKLRAISFAAIYVTISVLSNVLFVKVKGDTELDFGIAVLFTFIGKGIGNLILTYIVNRKWLKRYRRVVKTNGSKVYLPFFVDGTLSFLKDFAYRGALLAAPAMALASVVCDSIEPIVIFFLGVVFTLVSPKFGREKLDKKSILVRLAATGLVVVGIVLMQF